MVPSGLPCLVTATFIEFIERKIIGYRIVILRYESYRYQIDRALVPIIVGNVGRSAKRQVHSVVHSRSGCILLSAVSMRG
jgi:hypothetical protein